MTRSSPQRSSLLLGAWRDGDKAALDALMPVVYAELRRLAHRYMVHKRAGHPLQTSALANEAYLRQVNLDGIEWQDRAQVFAIAARFMRGILVDLACAGGYRKRGGGARKVLLDEALLVWPEPRTDLIRISDALNALAEFDARKAKWWRWAISAA